MQEPALTYILLVIPTLFALAVVGQGIYKISKQEKEGPVALGSGIIFLMLIAAAYWLFIK